MATQAQETPSPRRMGKAPAMPGTAKPKATVAETPAQMEARIRAEIVAEQAANQARAKEAASLISASIVGEVIEQDDGTVDVAVSFQAAPGNPIPDGSSFAGQTRYLAPRFVPVIARHVDGNGKATGNFSRFYLSGGGHTLATDSKGQPLNDKGKPFEGQ